MADDARYPWQVTVQAFHGDRPFKVGVQDGNVVLQPPPFGTSTADPDVADVLAADIKAAANRARRERQASQR